MSNDLYNKRGVSSDKHEVHYAIKNLDKGLFPKAFCKILPDFLAADDEYCNIIHADTAGTKPSLAYVYWKETNDLSVWKGIAQDALVMNIDDMACVGCTSDFIISSIIGRNKNLIPREVLEMVINGTQEFIESMAEFGIKIHHGGGETADVGDIIKTIDVGFTAMGRMKKSDLIINDIGADCVVVGFSSYGQSTYEQEPNSGIGCNGLTSARHDVFNKKYMQKYPESYDNNLNDEVVYCGKYSVTDTYDKLNTDIGKSVLSPTRTYLPLLKSILEQVDRSLIKGIIHNTGGGHTKVLKFLNNSTVIKNNLLPVPPIFDLIQLESKTTYYDMFKVFNMGQRLEIYTDENTAKILIEIANSFNILSQIIGYTISSSNPEVKVTYNSESLSYTC
ncbi:MAG: phosphoribosylformylglycinamidine cyclo-ligase [Saprospiraceae bacterium]|nr:phosphoribosylformylglycinamidine cyclo-ligase [Saprospiraceae bacterium]